MHNLIGNKVLITTQNWFYAPDGKQYRAVFGKLKSVNEAGKTLGFIPNRSHANWFIEVGNMVIMGCQVMYIIKCDFVEIGKVSEFQVNESGTSEYERPSQIYVCD